MVVRGRDAITHSLPGLSPEAIAELDQLYRTTHDDVRLRVRAHLILQAAEQHMLAPEIARILRCDERTMRTWLNRYMAEGVNGLADNAVGLVRRARSLPSTGSTCCELSGNGPAAWISLTGSVDLAAAGRQQLPGQRDRHPRGAGDGSCVSIC